MKIAVASDHAGFDFKEILKKHLEEKKHEVEDFGCYKKESCDYPEFGIPAAKSVALGKNERAILVCTNGIGMSMLANKISGVLAALVYSESNAAETRKHHDSNVLCLGAGEFSARKLLMFVDIWLAGKFEGDRHARRIEKVKDLDKR